MRYIKKYNESVDYNLKDYFMDFVDDGFKISIIEVNTMPKISLHYAGYYDTMNLLNKVRRSTSELEDKFSIFKLSITNQYNNTYIEFIIKDKEHKNDYVIEVKYKDDNNDICEYNLEVINVYITNIYNKNKISSPNPNINLLSDDRIGKVFLYGKDLHTEDFVRLEWIFKDGYTYDNYMNQDNFFYKDEHHSLSDFKIDEINANKVYNILASLDFNHQPGGSKKAFEKFKKEDLIKK